MLGRMANVVLKMKVRRAKKPPFAFCISRTPPQQMRNIPRGAAPAVPRPPGNHASLHAALRRPPLSKGLVAIVRSPWVVVGVWPKSVR